MTIERLRKKASITNEGAILVGNHIACDGADLNKPISIFSHAHGDHVKQFESALSSCEAVLVTKETKNLLIADRGNWLLKRRNLIELALGEEYEYKDTKVTLHPATHMLGSCQVRCVNGDGDEVVYTGDFSYPNTPVLKADVLVTEATYGTPGAVRTMSYKDLMKLLISITKEGVGNQKSVDIIAHPGKIQCIMNNLADSGIDVPFLATAKDLKWAEVYRQYDRKMGNIYDIRTSEALEIRKSNHPYITFHRFGGRIPATLNHVRIRASGFGARDEYYEVTKDNHVLALSDHADFQGLIEYIKKSDPKLVVTDWSRCDMAGELAEFIRGSLGIEAVALPHRL
jgi:putative mRNA 3-end processing factor